VASDRLQYVPQDRRLGRNVNHDPRSRRFPVRSDVPIGSVDHVRHVGIFDQGDIGSCTGNAALGCLATGPFWHSLSESSREHGPLSPTGRISWSREGAEAVYSAATLIDPFPGDWPPEDTGSDGLSVAKVLKAAGWISGYRHAFSLSDLLAGLMQVPCIVGTEWMSAMNDPNDEGIAHPVGRTEGGHEYICDGYEADRGLLWFTNSWGVGWGSLGTFAMPAEEFGILLDRQGDATFFVPLTEPQPEPEPERDPDAILAGKLRDWAAIRRSPSIKARKAVREWIEAKGL
jgi:hypothetical protein